MFFQKIYYICLDIKNLLNKYKYMKKLDFSPKKTLRENAEILRDANPFFDDTFKWKGPYVIGIRIPHYMKRSNGRDVKYLKPKGHYEIFDAKMNIVLNQYVLDDNGMTYINQNALENTNPGKKKELNLIQNKPIPSDYDTLPEQFIIVGVGDGIMGTGDTVDMSGLKVGDVAAYKPTGYREPSLFNHNGFVYQVLPIDNIILTTKIESL